MPAPKKPKAKIPGVRVRMYRQGLGDCFLLTFDPKGKAIHLLIDCGTLGAVSTGIKMAEVVADIRKETGGRLDVLVATHEHQDHVSGFRDQQPAFKQVEIGQVWLAWTENPIDPLAKAIAKHKNDLGKAVAAAAARLAGSKDPELKALADGVRDVLAFSGDAASPGSPSFATTVDEAMQFVRKGTGAETLYFDPGDIIETALLPGFRIYVLGPPRSMDKLSDLGDHGSDDLYSLAAALSGGEEGSIAWPFDARFRLKADSPAAEPNLRSYKNPANAWRRIDDEWLRSSSDLSLQLDKLTNNTSLALAIERVSDGRVLLFPADAQQGNWLSWHDAEIKWQVPTTAGGQQTVVARDLLERTVFYKVGHHGSHNATASVRGLELMKREKELTAFIPVDRAVALTRHPQGSWKMPAKTLYRRLLERCQGRVARSDIGWAANPAQAARKETENEFRPIATDPEWSAWASSQASSTVKVTDLYIDYHLS